MVISVEQPEEGGSRRFIFTDFPNEWLEKNSKEDLQWRIFTALHTSVRIDNITIQKTASSIPYAVVDVLGKGDANALTSLLPLNNGGRLAVKGGNLSVRRVGPKGMGIAYTREELLAFSRPKSDEKPAAVSPSHQHILDDILRCLGGELLRKGNGGSEGNGGDGEGKESTSSD